MAEDKKPIWTPSEQLPDQVKKMAWLLFLERWKITWSVLGDAAEEVDTETLQAIVNRSMWKEIHGECISAAQIIYKNEQPEAQPHPLSK